MSATLGPWHFLSFSGTLEDLRAGRSNPEALKDLEARLPQPNSLRRAGEDTKAAVVSAVELLKGAGVPVSEKMGLYVGQQQIALDYCARFIQTSYREGPRMASPMMFAESVANNVATHLSLTLGLKGVAQTFIGSRVAGMQAVMAAGEDVMSGHVDAGLVVILCGASAYNGDAYLSVYRPYQRRKRVEVAFLRGAVALLVRRDAPGQPRLVYSGVRCQGRLAGAQRDSVEALWKDAVPFVAKGTRRLDSALGLARERGGNAFGRIADGVPVDLPLAESYALDPFVRLLLDSRSHPGPEGRAILCLGEEGTAGALVLDGPAPVLQL